MESSQKPHFTDENTEAETGLKTYPGHCHESETTSDLYSVRWSVIWYYRFGKLAISTDTEYLNTPWSSIGNLGYMPRGNEDISPLTDTPKDVNSSTFVLAKIWRRLKCLSIENGYCAVEHSYTQQREWMIPSYTKMHGPISQS